MSSRNSRCRALLIADTGPLLALARIGQLPLLRLLFTDVQITQAVWQETQAKPEREDARVIQAAREQGIFTVITNPKFSQNFTSLDLGERSTLDAAIATQATVLIDEAKGRKKAQAHGITIVGCVGMLLLAKKAGHITQVTPLLNSLVASGYRLGDSLISKAKELANE